MKRRYGMALAMLASAGIGALAVQVLHAQSAPPAFYIAEVLEVTDAEGIKPYLAAVPATVQKFGGRYIVRGGKAVAGEGAPPNRIIVTAFKSMADAQAWYNSPEYSQIKPIRQRTSRSRNFIVEGLGE